MPITVKITTRDGQVIEVSDLSFAEAKELAGLNGHSSNGHSPLAKGMEPRPLSSLLKTTKINDYSGLKKDLTEKAQKFFRVLRENPNGINSDQLAEKMGFKSGSQLGGMTGGGISKTARRFGVEIETLYRHEVAFGPNGRTVTYYPGKNINLVL